LSSSRKINQFSEVCGEVAVMRAGRVVEYGPAQRILVDPEHEYTRALLAAAPGRNFAFCTA
jgi:peptide/nickel transport system ATP-binding protein